MPVDHFKPNSTVPSEGFVVIDFSAAWCGPCKMIAPKFNAWSDDAKYSKIKFIKIDVDECEDIAQAFDVEAMPTFLFIKDNAVVKRVTGANPVEVEAGLNLLAAT